MEPAIEVERDGLSVEVARRPNGLTLTVHVPSELVGPAAEMVDALRRQLGPGGSVEGAAEAAGALAGLCDGARVTSALLMAKAQRAAA